MAPAGVTARTRRGERDSRSPLFTIYARYESKSFIFTEVIHAKNLDISMVMNEMNEMNDFFIKLIQR